MSSTTAGVANHKCWINKVRLSCVFLIKPSQNRSRGSEKPTSASNFIQHHLLDRGPTGCSSCQCSWTCSCSFLKRKTLFSSNSKFHAGMARSSTPPPLELRAPTCCSTLGTMAHRSRSFFSAYSCVSFSIPPTFCSSYHAAKPSTWCRGNAKPCAQHPYSFISTTPRGSGCIVTLPAAKYNKRRSGVATPQIQKMENGVMFRPKAE